MKKPAIILLALSLSGFGVIGYVASEYLLPHQTQASINYYSWSCAQLQDKINSLINQTDSQTWQNSYARGSDVEALELQHVYEEKGCHP